VPATNSYFVVCGHDRLRLPMVGAFLEWLRAEARGEGAGG
jgi:hypothetical protein